MLERVVSVHPLFPTSLYGQVAKPCGKFVIVYVAFIAIVKTIERSNARATLDLDSLGLAQVDNDVFKSL